jgi:hypothetical protein
MSLYIKFTGDYSKLKSMGYVFQRLFAGNYMQWCSDGGEGELRVWKRGAELTIGRYINHEGDFLYHLLKYREDDKPLPLKHNCVPVWIQNETDKVSLDDATHWEGYMANMMLWNDAIKADESTDDLPLYEWSQVPAKPKLIKDVMELYDMGWIEVADTQSEAYTS